MAFRLKQELLSGPDSIEDVIKVEPNIALIDPNKTSGRRHRGLLVDLVDTFFGLIDRLTSNTIRGLDQRVEDLDERDAIPAKYLVAGMKASVLNNASAADVLAGVDNGPAEFVALRDSAGPLTVYRNARYLDFRTVKARWVRSDGSLDERVASYAPLLLSNDPHEKDDVVKWTFAGGRTRLLQLKQNIPLAGAGVNNPVPTGLENDPYYLNFSPLDSVKPFFVVMPYADVLNLAADEQLPQGASLLITNRTNGQDNVFAQVISSAQVAFDDAYRVGQDQDGFYYEPVAYYLSDDTTTQRQAEQDISTLTGLHYDLVARVLSLESGGAGGYDVTVGDWNPVDNLLAAGGSLSATQFPVKGRTYRVTANALPVTVALTTDSPAQGDSYVTVPNGTIIGPGYIMTGAGIPANTVVTQATQGGGVYLNRSVTLAAGLVVTLTPGFAGFSRLYVDDLLYSTGVSWRLRPGIPRINAAAPVASGGIDYTTPVTHSASAVLTAADMGKQHLLTGATGTLTLPAAAANLGKQIAFLVPAGHNTKMYEILAAGGDLIDGQGSRLQWETESKTLLAVAGGWTKVASNTRKLSVELQVDMTSTANKFIPNGDTGLVRPQIPFPVLGYLKGPASMRVGVDYIRTLREGIYAVQATLIGAASAGLASGDVMFIYNAPADGFDGDYNYGVGSKFKSAGNLADSSGYFNGGASKYMDCERGARISCGVYMNGPSNSLTLDRTPASHTSIFSIIEDSPW